MPHQPTTPAPPWPHPDNRARETIRAAWHDGYAAGEREHYITGWRAGLRLGAFVAAAACFPLGMVSSLWAVKLGVMAALQ